MPSLHYYIELFGTQWDTVNDILGNLNYDQCQSVRICFSNSVSNKCRRLRHVSTAKLNHSVLMNILNWKFYSTNDRILRSLKKLIYIYSCYGTTIAFILFDNDTLWLHFKERVRIFHLENRHVHTFDYNKTAWTSRQVCYFS